MPINLPKLLETLQKYNAEINRIKMLLAQQPVDQYKLKRKVGDLLQDAHKQEHWMVYDYFLTFLQFKLENYPHLIEQINQTRLTHYQSLATRQDSLRKEFETNIGALTQASLNNKIHPRVCIQLIYYYKKVILDSNLFNQYFLQFQKNTGIDDNLIQWLENKKVKSVHRFISKPEDKTNPWLAMLASSVFYFLSFAKQHKHIVILILLLLLCIRVRAENNSLQTKNKDHGLELPMNHSHLDIVVSETVVHYGLQKTEEFFLEPEPLLDLEEVAKNIYVHGKNITVDGNKIVVTMTPSLRDNAPRIFGTTLPLKQGNLYGKLTRLRHLEFSLNSQQKIVFNSLPSFIVTDSNLEEAPKNILLDVELNERERLDLSIFQLTSNSNTNRDVEFENTDTGTRVKSDGRIIMTILYDNTQSQATIIISNSFYILELHTTKPLTRKNFIFDSNVGCRSNRERKNLKHLYQKDQNNDPREKIYGSKNDAKIYLISAGDNDNQIDCSNTNWGNNNLEIQASEFINTNDAVTTPPSCGKTIVDVGGGEDTVRLTHGNCEVNLILRPNSRVTIEDFSIPNALSFVFTTKTQPGFQYMLDSKNSDQFNLEMRQINNATELLAIENNIIVRLKDFTDIRALCAAMQKDQHLNFLFGRLAELTCYDSNGFTGFTSRNDMPSTVFFSGRIESNGVETFSLKPSLVIDPTTSVVTVTVNSGSNMTRLLPYGNDDEDSNVMSLQFSGNADAVNNYLVGLKIKPQLEKNWGSKKAQLTIQVFDDMHMITKEIDVYASSYHLPVFTGEENFVRRIPNGSDILYAPPWVYFDSSRERLLAHPLYPYPQPIEIYLRREKVTYVVVLRVDTALQSLAIAWFLTLISIGVMAYLSYKITKRVKQLDNAIFEAEASVVNREFDVAETLWLRIARQYPTVFTNYMLDLSSGPTSKFYETMIAYAVELALKQRRGMIPYEFIKFLPPEALRLNFKRNYKIGKSTLSNLLLAAANYFFENNKVTEADRCIVYATVISPRELTYYFENLLHNGNLNDEFTQEIIWTLMLRAKKVPSCIATQKMLFVIGEFLAIHDRKKPEALFFLFMSGNEEAKRLTHLLIANLWISRQSNYDSPDHILSASTEFLKLLQRRANLDEYKKLIPTIAQRFLKYVLDNQYQAFLHTIHDQFLELANDPKAQQPKTVFFKRYEPTADAKYKKIEISLPKVRSATSYVL